ncbi:hypothetical protein AAFF_G00066390, partial [Aldrovandia affinis]
MPSWSTFQRESRFRGLRCLAPGNQLKSISPKCFFVCVDVCAADYQLLIELACLSSAIYILQSSKKNPFNLKCFLRSVCLSNKKRST